MTAVQLPGMPTVDVDHIRDVRLHRLQHVARDLLHASQLLALDTNAFDGQSDMWISGLEEYAYDLRARAARNLGIT